MLLQNPHVPAEMFLMHDDRDFEEPLLENQEAAAFDSSSVLLDCPRGLNAVLGAPALPANSVLCLTLGSCRDAARDCHPPHPNFLKY